MNVDIWVWHEAINLVGFLICFSVSVYYFTKITLKLFMHIITHLCSITFVPNPINILASNVFIVQRPCWSPLNFLRIASTGSDILIVRLWLQPFLYVHICMSVFSTLTWVSRCMHKISCGLHELITYSTNAFNKVVTDIFAKSSFISVQNWVFYWLGKYRQFNIYFKVKVWRNLNTIRLLLQSNQYADMTWLHYMT